MKTTLFRVLLLTLSLGLGVAEIRAQDLNAVRARMEQRLSTVDQLKDRKLLGENNRGFLEPRAALAAADEKLMADENADRAAVYAALAAQYGVPAEEVGRKRAEKIAGASRPGVWIQMPDGTWFEKR